MQILAARRLPVRRLMSSLPTSSSTTQSSIDPGGTIDPMLLRSKLIASSPHNLLELYHSHKASFHSGLHYSTLLHSLNLLPHSHLSLLPQNPHFATFMSDLSYRFINRFDDFSHYDISRIFRAIGKIHRAKERREFSQRAQERHPPPQQTSSTHGGSWFSSLFLTDSGPDDPRDPTQQHSANESFAAILDKLSTHPHALHPSSPEAPTRRSPVPLDLFYITSVLSAYTLTRTPSPLFSLIDDLADPTPGSSAASFVDTSSARDLTTLLFQYTKMHQYCGSDAYVPTNLIRLLTTPGTARYLYEHCSLREIENLQYCFQHFYGVTKVSVGCSSRTHGFNKTKNAWRARRRAEREQAFRTTGDKCAATRPCTRALTKASTPSPAQPLSMCSNRPPFVYTCVWFECYSHVTRVYRPLCSHVCVASSAEHSGAA